eukprot:1294672-Prorocentrum_lima.AAC.1
MQPIYLGDRGGGKRRRVEQVVVCTEPSWQALHVQGPSTRNPVTGPEDPNLTLEDVRIAEAAGAFFRAA